MEKKANPNVRVEGPAEVDKKKLVKVIVPLGIVLVVAGLWFVKNADKGSTAQTIPVENAASAELAAPKNAEDFVLEASAIDLPSLKAYGMPIIIDFGADSCIPCKEMAPVLKKMNAEMQGTAIIKFVDVWKNGNAANGFPIQVIPTQVLVNADGTPYMPSDSMNDAGISFTKYSSRDTGEHVFTVHQGGLTEDQMRLILADMGTAQ